MTRWHSDTVRVEELFHGAVDLPPATRREWLLGQCGGDEELLRRVQALLDADAEAEDLERSPVRLPFAAGPGETLGQYRIVRQIGVGGFGAVFEAEQAAPRRRVALKVLRDPFATPAMQRRFEHEIELLGTLDHPGICRILAAGQDGGRPFFAMELVEGVPLGQFVAAHALSVRAKVELWLQIVDAIAHAHLRGVIHRDLKPQNVLVAGDAVAPCARLLDFGIGRRLGEGAAGLTASGQVLGTAEYMSPEQFRGDAAAVDVRADVWSLGVLLHELLAGALPHDVRGKSLFEAGAIVCADSPRPLRVDGELDASLAAIVQHCLELEPARRYQSSASLAQDVRAWLAGEPVLAQGQSAMGQLRALARRHRVLLRASAAVFVALVAGTAASLYFAFHARDERDVANQILQFLTRDMIGAADPKLSGSASLTVRDALDRARDRLGDRFHDRPDVRGPIVATLGNTYLSLGQWETARPLLEDAERLLAEAHGPVDDRTFEARQKHAEVLEQLGEERALELRERLLADVRAARGPDHPLAMTALDCFAHTLLQVGEVERARALHAEAQERRTRVLGAEHPDTLVSANNLASAESRLGHYRRAAEIDRATWEVRRRVLGEDHPHTISSQANLALNLLYDHWDSGYDERLREAAELTAAAIRQRRAILGPHHPETLNSINNLMLIQLRENDLDGAEATGRELMAASTAALGPEHADTLRVIANFCDSLCSSQDRAKWEEAKELSLRTLEIAERTMEPRNWVLAWHLKSAAMPLLRLAEFERSRDLLVRALTIFRATLGDEHDRTVSTARRLVQVSTLGKLPIEPDWQAIAKPAREEK